MLLQLRVAVLCCLLILLATISQAAPPQADWFPQAPPLAKPTGEVIHVKTVEQLMAAVRDVKPGGTILVADGHYRLPVYIEITADNVTLRSASGNRDNVILDGVTSRHGELIGPPILITSKSQLKPQDNSVFASLAKANAAQAKTGQSFLSAAQLNSAIELPIAYADQQSQQQAALQKAGEQSKEVIEAMRKVHAGFQGQAGYVAQFGDSITYTMAFWTPIGWDNPEQYLTQDDGLPKTPKNTRWRDYVTGTRDKGPQHANYSGWTVGQLNKAVDDVIARDKPEVAIIMIGTNDISGGKVPQAYRQGLEQVVQKCLDAHCVPILNTIPPRRGRDDAVAAANEIIRNVATEKHIPLADFHAECLRLRPDDTWDKTIISEDGVHPSGGKANVYTEDNMKNCGYALRNWVNFLALRQVYFHVINND